MVLKLNKTRKQGWFSRRFRQQSHQLIVGLMAEPCLWTVQVLRARDKQIKRASITVRYLSSFVYSANLTFSNFVILHRFSWFELITAVVLGLQALMLVVKFNTLSYVKTWILMTVLAPKVKNCELQLYKLFTFLYSTTNITRSQHL